jgi:hypothetical protein
MQLGAGRFAYKPPVSGGYSGGPVLKRLRHTTASFPIGAWANVNVVQRVFGHASATLNTGENSA